jgi:hypothetical protein
MKNVKIILLLMATTICMSFTDSKLSNLQTLKLGTYSSCSCEKTIENSLKFGLTLNEDFTFNYFDNTNTSKKVSVKGTWSLDKNSILLKDYPTDTGLDNKWTIDNNGICIKSKKGLSFTRLCNVNECN